MKIHSYLSNKCEAKQKSKIHRFGVFAKEDIKAGELITIWGGYIMTLEEVEKLPQDILRYEYPVQVYEGVFLGPKTVADLDDAEMFNHSCTPNAGIKGQNLLIARRDINKGEEICFDYETTDTQEMNFKCKCGSFLCRKMITGNAWKDKKFQRQNKGYLSWYIEEKIRMLSNKKTHTYKQTAQSIPHPNTTTS